MRKSKTAQPTGAEADAFVEAKRRKRGDFKAAVDRQVELVTKDPGRHQVRVLLLACLGYAYVFAVTVALSTALRLIGLSLHRGHTPRSGILDLVLYLALTLLLLVLASFKIPPPAGEEVTRGEAPELFNLVDSIARESGAPVPDAILLSEKVTAEVGQLLRFGLFGRTKRYLVLGLPLLHLMPPEEGAAVIAHELGHLARERSRLGLWAYNVDAVWNAIRVRSETRRGLRNLVLGPFARWYSPKLRSATLALRRNEEFGADAFAAHRRGAETMAMALMRLAYAHRHLNLEFEMALRRENRMRAEPPDVLGADLLTAVRRAPRAGLIHSWLSRALEREAAPDDTHPPLADRLRALGIDRQRENEFARLLARPIPVTASESLLGDQLPSIAARVGHRMADDLREEWGKTYRNHQAGRERLDRLSPVEAGSSGRRNYLSTRAYLTLNHVSAMSAEPRFRDALAEFPEDDEIRFGLAKALMSLNQPEGAEMMERLIERRPEWTERAFKVLHVFYGRSGDQPMLKSVERRHAEHAARQEFASKAFLDMSLTNTLASHGLEPEQVDRIVEQLHGRKDIDRVYLVRKELAGLGLSRPVLVAFRARRFGFREPRRAALSGRLRKALKLPVRLIIFTPDSNRKWRKRLDSIPDSLIFDRNGNVR